MIEVLHAEYVGFATAKGLRRRVVLGRHVLRNASISTVTLLGSEHRLAGRRRCDHRDGVRHPWRRPPDGRQHLLSRLRRRAGADDGAVLWWSPSCSSPSMPCRRCSIPRVIGVSGGGRARSAPAGPRPGRGCREAQRQRAGWRLMPAAPFCSCCSLARCCRNASRPIRLMRSTTTRCSSRRASAHPFGTDNFGRDILSRTIWAARIDLQIAIFGTLFPAVFGTFVGCADRLRRRPR